MTAAFAVVYGIVLRPLPYRDAARLVVTLDEIRPADYRDVRDRNGVFSQTTFAGLDAGILGTPDGPRRVSVLSISPNFFSVLGFAPHPGRNFAPRDYESGDSRTVIISQRLQADLFGSGSPTVGQIIALNSRLLTIVGVVPDRWAFRLYWPAKPVDLYIPLVLTPRQRALRGVAPNTFDDRYSVFPYFSFFIAKLRRGLTRQRAQRALDRIVAGLIAEHPEDADLRGLRLWTLKRTRVRLAGQSLWPLLALCLAFLAIACVNVAGLCLARWLGREREMAIRAALGAGPARLAALPIAEALWLGLAAAVFGTLLSLWVVRAFRATAPSSMLPRLSHVAVDWKVLIVAAAASFLAAVLAAAAAAMLRRKANPAAALRCLARLPTRSPRGRRRFAGQGLVFAQCAIATLFLAVAGLMLSGVLRLTHAALGFQPQHVMQAELERATIGRQAWNKAQNARLWAIVQARAATLPGVQSAALTSSPFGLVGQGSFKVVAGGTVSPGSANWSSVSPGYFSTLRIPLLAGRGFSRADTLRAPLVAVVNQGFARMYLGGSPLGRTIEFQRAPQGKWYRLRIVGVARDTAIAGTWQTAGLPAIYVDMLQFPLPAAILLARNAPGAYASPRNFAQAAATLGGGMLVQGAESMRRNMAEMLRLPRFFGSLLAAFALLALLLASSGVYGVASVTAWLNTRELAIRRALGASPARTIGASLLPTLAPAAAGAACGLLAANALTAILKTWLFGLRPSGFTAFPAAATALLLACLFAALPPTLRALRDEPAQALRLE